jgi:hypothetical protein
MRFIVGQAPQTRDYQSGSLTPRNPQLPRKPPTHSLGHNALLAKARGADDLEDIEVEGNGIRLKTRAEEVLRRVLYPRRTLLESEEKEKETAHLMAAMSGEVRWGPMPV